MMMMKCDGAVFCIGTLVSECANRNGDLKCHNVVTVMTQSRYLCLQVSVTGVCVGVGVPQGLESANTTISLSSRGSFKHSLYWLSAVKIL